MIFLLMFKYYFLFLVVCATLYHSGSSGKRQPVHFTHSLTYPAMFVAEMIAQDHLVMV